MSDDFGVGVFRKKTLVTGVQAVESGVIETERGPMAYGPGDWLLSTIEPGGPTAQTWPVSDEYLRANYEAVVEG